MRAFQLFLIEFQSLFLRSFRRIGHIAFPRLFNTEDIAGKTTTNEHFSEESPAFLVLQSIDGKDLAAFHIGQAKDSLDVIETLLELALVKQHDNI